MIKLIILETEQFIVQQYDGHIFYPTTYLNYYNLSADEQIINFCLLLQYKYDSHVILMTSDNNMIAQANAKGVSRVWNPSDKKRIKKLSYFLTSNGLV